MLWHFRIKPTFPETQGDAHTVVQSYWSIHVTCCLASTNLTDQERMLEFRVLRNLHHSCCNFFPYSPFPHCGGIRKGCAEAFLCCQQLAKFWALWNKKQQPAPGGLESTRNRGGHFLSHSWLKKIHSRNKTSIQWLETSRWDDVHSGIES